jgi:Glycosyltransferases involved in cell wall biogenesis
MKISIIVPVYNASKYLHSCIESILNQTHKDLEIILIDDGSTDESPRICRYYAEKDNRILFISQKNQGPGIARNAGLNIASGDYIGFVDSDDYISPDMYENMLNLGLKSKADIVHCGYEKVDIHGKVVKKSKLKDITITGNKNCVLEFCLKRNANNFTYCKLIKKDIIGNIRFSNLKQSEDALFLLEVFMNCNVLSVTNNPYYKYVQTPDSICRTNFNLSKLDTVKAGKELYKIVNYRYPDLSIYFAKYTARYALRCYVGIYYMENLHGKKELLETTYNDFSENFKKVKASNLKLLDWFSEIYLKLFYHFPNFAAKLTSLAKKHL